MDVQEVYKEEMILGEDLTCSSSAECPGSDEAPLEPLAGRVADCLLFAVLCQNSHIH